MCYTETMMDLNVFSGKKICVATSGGLDSTALLHYLKKREAACGYVLCALHCEHGIRGEESLKDMRFVQNLCKEWGVPLFLFQEDCLQRAQREKSSVETAARAFRRDCYARLIGEGKADYIATAHHADDEAETVLFRIARGASLSGASGMRAQEGNLLRPFLDWSKDRLRAYAEENGLSYCTDNTNFSTEYTRNKLRLTVFPALEEAVAGAKENFARFAALAAEDDEYLYQKSRELLTENTANGGYIVAFCEEAPLFRRACLLAIKRLGVERDYTSVHLQSVFALQRSERGARIDLPQNVVAEKTQTGIALFLRTERTEISTETLLEKPFSESGFEGGMYTVNVSQTPSLEEKCEGQILRIDLDKLPADAVFRFRREGDEIEKFGGGKKSLKKFFNEKKLPVSARAHWPLIASKETGEVYVVCGVEIEERIKITKDTVHALYITLKKRQ